MSSDQPRETNAACRTGQAVVLMRSGVDPGDPATRNERFEFGLACLLDGIAARVAPEPPSE